MLCMSYWLNSILPPCYVGEVSAGLKQSHPSVIFRVLMEMVLILIVLIFQCFIQSSFKSKHIINNK